MINELIISKKSKLPIEGDDYSIWTDGKKKKLFIKINGKKWVTDFIGNMEIIINTDDIKKPQCVIEAVY